MSDRDLDDLLAGWRAPSPSERIERRILQHQRRRWISWLLQGHVQLPVPVLALIVLSVLFLVVLVARKPTMNEFRAARSEGLQPVKHLQIRIIRSTYEIGN